MNPCQPSPCGPHSECVATPQGGARCTCLRDYVGTPPHCRPECVSSSDCAADKACVNRKCVDPCPGSCGQRALCRAVVHSALCYCPPGLVGDARDACVEPPKPVADPLPCQPNPCGTNAICLPQRGLSVCQCLPDYYGNPYEICRPECTRNSDCSSDLACVNEKCRDPCPGVCGINALCQVVNHLPICDCLPHHVGNPYHSCRLLQQERKKTNQKANPN